MKNNEVVKEDKKYFKVICIGCNSYIKYTYEEFLKGKQAGYLVCKNCGSLIKIK